MEDQYIYETNADNTARYVIGTKGKNPLIVMSINPSVGSPTRTSPTLGTVRHIAADYGYDSWIILCLYPQRATHLNELDQNADPQLVEENEKGGVGNALSCALLLSAMFEKDRRDRE